MQIVHSLEIECDGRIAIACGADWAEAEHRLYSKVISYAMSVALAEALCARRAAA